MTMNLLKMLGMTDLLKESINDVKTMHDECLEMFEMAWEANEEHDPKKAEIVMGKDERIDELEVKVRETVLNYLAGMPAGGNVPLSLVLIDTANQFERLADHISFIADSAIKYPCLNGDDFSDLLRAEKELAKEMLEKTSTAFDTCDEQAAEYVIGMYRNLKDSYEHFIEKLDKSDLSMHRAIGLILVSRNLLRIGKKSASIMEFCLKPYPEAGN